MFNFFSIKKKSDITKIKISLAELPTTRYVRRVNKTNLDLMSKYLTLILYILIYLSLYHSFKKELSFCVVLCKQLDIICLSHFRGFLNIC